MRLTATSPPQSFTEPLTTTEARTFLRIEYGTSTDTLQEDELTLMINAARGAAEVFQNRDLVRKQWDMVMDYWPGWHIGLRDPLVSVDVFKYKDKDANVTNMVLNTDYIVDLMKSTPIVTVPANTFWPRFDPWRSSAITLTFTSGYLTTDSWWKNTPGSMVKRGMLLLIAHWFDNRIPFTREIGNVAEFPWTVTNLLGIGANER